MSYVSLKGKYKKKEGKNRWLNQKETQERMYKILYPSKEILFGPRKVGDTFQKDRSSALDLLGLIVGRKSSGKSTLLNDVIQDYIDNYGEDLVSIYASKNVEDVLGEFNEDTGKFIGGVLSDKPIHLVVIEDGLTFLGNAAPPSTIKKFNQIFETARHLIKFKDEHNNRRGLIAFFINVQDYYKLNINARRSFSFIIYKSIMQNEVNLNEFNKRCPKEGIELLEDFTEKITLHDPDNSYKNKNVVNFGGGKWGMFKSKWVDIDYTREYGPWWVTASTRIDRMSQTNSSNIEPEVDMDQKEPDNVEPIQTPNSDIPRRIYTNREMNVLMKGKITYNLIKTDPLPTEMLEEAFQIMKDKPYTMGKNSKYKPELHWDVAYRYYVKAEAVDFIANDIGKSSSVITNGYADGGYVAILVQEQLGHAFEPVMANRWIRDYDWVYITGQFRSDLIQLNALHRELGFGVHGEVKTRTKKESPQLDWMSTEMKEHVLLGGKAVLYQVVLKRRGVRLHHKIYEYEIIFNGGSE